MALNNLGLGLLINVAGNAARQLDKIEGGFNGVMDAARRAGKSGQTFNQGFKGLMQSDRARAAMQATGVGMMGIGTAAGVGVGMAVTEFGNFEQQMLNVQATADLTKEAYKELSDFAVDLGADTKFSAEQAANALYEISSAGYSGTGQLETLTEGSAALAAAIGSDLPYAASVMTSTLKAYQLEADEAGRVTDILAKATALSSLRGSDMQLAYGQVAGVANMVGQTIEQTTTGMMALSNAGIGASDGATSLKTAMMMLIKPTEEAQSVMDTLGISTRDAQGNMLSWPDLVGEFESAFGNVDGVMAKFRGAAGMTESELEAFAKANHLTESQLGGFIQKAFEGEQAFKEYAMATVFGQDGIRAMATGLSAQTTVMKDGQEMTLTGADALREWEKQLQNSGGSAQKMADIMNSGVNADIEQMRGAAQSAAITLGQNLAPEISWVSEKLGGLFTWFSGLPAPIQKTAAVGLLLMTAFGLLGGAGLVLLAQLPNIIQGAKDAGKAMRFMGRNIRAAGTASKGAVKKISAHTAAVGKNTMAASKNGAKWLAQKSLMVGMKLATAAWTAAQWALNVAMNANPIGLIILVILALVGVFILAYNKVDWFRNAVNAAWDGIVAGAKWLWEKIKWYFQLQYEKFLWLVEKAKWLGGAIVDGVKVIVDWFRELPGKIMSFLSELPEKALEFGKNFVKMIGDGIASGVTYVKDKVTGVADSIKDFLGFGSPTKKGPGADSDTWMPNMIGMLSSDLDQGAKVVGNSAARIAQAAKDGIESQRPTIQTQMTDPASAPIQTTTAAPGMRPRPIAVQSVPQADEVGQATATAVTQAAQAAGAQQKTTASGNQIIQLVVDGQVLAQILANLQGEQQARGGAY